jgi:thioredoxin reductase (NADPH)
LADRGEEMALVLAANTASVTADDGLLVHVREMHPHAKCALLVPSDVWADKSSANEIRALIALGRVHYYAVRPAGPPDEVFHEAISSFLLEWATERRTVPHTIHIVGESWSGRAYELRKPSSAARLRTPSAWRTPMRGARCSPRQAPRPSCRSWSFPMAGS